MSTTREPGAAALYRIDPGGEVHGVIAGTTISNGLGWSPSGERMYFVDSTTQRIDVLAYDVATGEAGARQPFAEIEGGMPDGLAVDADGAVWVCLFGGGEVRRYTPGGELDGRARLPVSKPTSLAFGGADLATLFVTSARQPGEPLAGAVFALRPGVAGVPVARFAG
jgi:sugar lactone lactonase YvrE